MEVKFLAQGNNRRLFWDSNSHLTDYESDVLHTSPLINYLMTESLYWQTIDMTSKCLVLNMHNGLKAHVYSDKQIHVNVNTIVSFVIQSGHVLEGGAISIAPHLITDQAFKYHWGSGFGVLWVI